MAERKLKIKFNKENLSDFEKTRIIPLGGLSKIGLNILLIETSKSLIAIDCGMSFPEDEIGLDKIIPDISYIKNKIKKFKGFFITHGHEDHIGALSVLLEDISSDVYGLKLSCELIKRKQLELGKYMFDCIHTVNPNERIPLGDIEIEFIQTSHSIPDAAALAIYTPDGLIFHTGDFKIDLSAKGPNAIDFSRLTKLGQENVLLMMTDSTNSIKSGWTESEQRVGERLLSIFTKYKNERIIISTFSSNIGRIQNIINAAEKTGRRVFIEGKSMMNTISLAKELGYLKYDKDSLTNDYNHINQRNSVMIVTGSQGEPNSVLARIARNEHPKIKLRATDVIVFSSKVIPGNENSVTKILNDLIKAGVRNIIRDVHTSGHAKQEELKLMAKIISPKYIMPIHGDYYQRYVACQSFKEIGYDKDHLLFVKDGDVVQLNETVERIGEIPAVKYYLDGRTLVDSKLIEERKRLQSNGCTVIIYDQTKQEIVKFILFGILIPQELQQYLINKFLHFTGKSLEEEYLRSKISEEFYAVTGKQPMISVTVI